MTFSRHRLCHKYVNTVSCIDRDLLLTVLALHNIMNINILEDAIKGKILYGFFSKISFVSVSLRNLSYKVI